MCDFNFSDPDQLFGNEAAEHEDQNIFDSYAVDRPELKTFLDQSKPLQIVSAYKGEGKSALLRLIENKLLENNPRPIVIRISATAISPSEEVTDTDSWIRAWKKALFRQIALEIGRNINMAFSDDAISLVEEAETEGFRNRSLVGSIVTRLQSTAVPINKTSSKISNHEAIMKRWSQKGSIIWMLLDDIDQNFKNNDYDKTKVATCLIAVSQIFSSVPEIRLRLTLRPNVWATIKTEFEALSHVKQYIKGLSWSEREFEEILSKRIESYLKRTNQWASVSNKLPASLSTRKAALISLAFETPVYWGGGNNKRHINVPLHTLSRHRPRWLIELCKSAAIGADSNDHSKITLEDITDQLGAFGQARIEDTVVEFHPQCDKIKELLIAFSGRNERFTTDELIGVIKNSIMQNVHPKIVGVIGTPGPKEIAHFLYQIGFLSARKDFDDGTYKHVSYAERPNLLQTVTNLDEGMSWEIHPVFRQTLDLKNTPSKSERKRSYRGRT